MNAKLIFGVFIIIASIGIASCGECTDLAIKVDDACVPSELIFLWWEQEKCVKFFILTFLLFFVFKSRSHWETPVVQVVNVLQPCLEAYANLGNVNVQNPHSIIMGFAKIPG